METKRVLLDFKSSYMFQFYLSALFEYLFYGSTAFINILLFQCGDQLKQTYRRQILQFEVDPCAVSVQGVNKLLKFHLVIPNKIIL